MKSAAPASRPTPPRRSRRVTSSLRRSMTVLRRPFAAATNFTPKKRRPQLLPLVARRLGTWIARALGHSIQWLQNAIQSICPYLPREAGPVLCLLLTYAGVSSSTVLIAAHVLPSVFTTLRPDTIISSALALPLAALVFDIRSYQRWRQSQHAPVMRRAVHVYCDGLLWSYWISTPLIDRLKRLRQKNPPRIGTTTRRSP